MVNGWLWGFPMGTENLSSLAHLLKCSPGCEWSMLMALCVQLVWHDTRSPLLLLPPLHCFMSKTCVTKKDHTAWHCIGSGRENPLLGCEHVSASYAGLSHGPGGVRSWPSLRCSPDTIHLLLSGLSSGTFQKLSKLLKNIKHLNKKFQIKI